MPPGLGLESNQLLRASEECGLLILKPTINGRQARILVDSGASTSFLDDRFAKSAGVAVQSNKVDQPVRLGNGHICQAAGYASKVSIDYPYHTESVDFVVMRLGKYDAVFGMTWLVSHNPVIDWPTGTISLSKDRHQKAVDTQPKQGVESRLLTLEEIREDPLPDTISFLALISEKHVSPSTNETGRYASLLREYADVGPDDLPAGLPPKRNIDLVIRLLPHTEPPSRAAYRLSRDELEELKRQLDG